MEVEKEALNKSKKSVELGEHTSRYFKKHDEERSQDSYEGTTTSPQILVFSFSKSSAKFHTC
jgi:hypothetical protein